MTTEARDPAADRRLADGILERFRVASPRVAATALRYWIDRALAAEAKVNTWREHAR